MQKCVFSTTYIVMLHSIVMLDRHCLAYPDPGKLDRLWYARQDASGNAPRFPGEVVRSRTPPSQSWIVPCRPIPTGHPPAAPPPREIHAPTAPSAGNSPLIFQGLSIYLS